MSENEYRFGECINCGKLGALKNGFCAKCRKKCKENFPDILKEIFSDYPKND